MSRLSLVLGGIAVLAATGCTSVGYLFQAAEGQCDISCRARPLDEALEDEDLDPGLAAVLRHVPAIKRFAEQSGLEPTPNYDDYVHLDRGAAVYVVSASHPLAFESLRWSFPIVGSVPYLGWFDLMDARRFAAELREDGWDVDLRGASAYSTLGWFADPILSSMVDGDVDALGDLANTILHESVHATTYVSSQSTFNESLANFVGDALTIAYLEQTFGVGGPEVTVWLEGEEVGKKRAARMHEAYLHLEKLYASDAPVETKLAEKSQYLAELRLELSFHRPMNNATLAGFKTYNAGDNEFEALLQACGQDWSRFWEVVRTIDDSAFYEEQQEDLGPVVDPLVQGKCVAK